jgi:(p)ppGpp synthase/HD superfamily hydrolase
MTVRLAYDAEILARRAHAGQFRRPIGDEPALPYYTHVQAVATAVQEAHHPSIAVATAWLHDVIEDTAETAESLLSYGFPADLVEAVVAITKRDGELYDSYLARVKANRWATIVKIEDIKHNLSGSPRPKTRAKYLKALKFLQS